MSSPPPLPGPRSTFVTTLAWIFITLAGFATLIALLQNLTLQTVLEPMMQRMAAQHPMPPGTPPAMIWLTLHLAWFFRAVLLLAVVNLVAAMALLRRHEWGRQLFIGAMGFDILYQLDGLAMQWLFMRPMMHAGFAFQSPRISAPHLSAAASAQIAQSTQQMMDGMLTVMQVFATLMALAFIVLFGWIILRLRRPAIRREFSTAAAPC